MSGIGYLGRSAHILLIEDNPDDVSLTKLAFDEIDMAHDLHVTRDGYEAMAFLRREGAFPDAPYPDLILLDLNMPGKDGRTTLKEIKEDPNLKRIPVVVLTTSDAATDTLLAYSYHANAYLTKPTDLDEWDDMVQAFANFWLRLVRYPPPVPQGVA